jgi:hypothetical protein
MPEWLWGHKTVALFDVWSIEHVLAGLSIGALVIKARAFVLLGGEPMQRLVNVRVDLLGVLFLSYLWETVEHYLEEGLAGDAVAFWFAGVEMWGNRLLTDPLMVVLGYLVVARHPRLVWPARVLSAVWVIVHVFVFPHSMYLHELF